MASFGSYGVNVAAVLVVRMTPTGTVSVVPSTTLSSPVRPLASASLYQLGQYQIAGLGIEEDALAGSPLRARA